MQEKPSNESTKPTVRALEARIARTKTALAAIGDMRPGHLSVQMRPSGQGRRPYTQSSYTYRKQGHTDYIRPEDLPWVKAEGEAYRKFKDLFERLVGLSIELSKLKSASSPASPSLASSPFRHFVAFSSPRKKGMTFPPEKPMMPRL